MKVCVFQPKFPYKEEEADAYIRFLLDTLDRCDESLDLIVLPECCNAPNAYGTVEAFHEAIEKNTKPLLDKVRETALRCRALVSVNLYCGRDGFYRNTTLVFGRDGKIKGKYLKQHLPSPEKERKKVDDSYVYAYQPPYSVEIEGIRYGFLTCYDCYYNEFIAHMATQRLDVVLVSAYQRSERGDILEMQTKNVAFNCNAYVVRSSVSMGAEDYPYGGSTMVVKPDGTVLQNIGQRVGVLTCEFDPEVKHRRPDGYGRAEILNERYIEKGRTPWSYRPCGPSVIPGEKALPYPRVCSHRGFNTIAPENTMAAFGPSVALGADEIELDIWPTRDGRLVVCHDDSVDRTSDGSGRLIDLTWGEIQRFNIGAKYAPPFDGLRFPLFEQVLKQFARQTVINLHIKSAGQAEEYDHDIFRRMVELIYRYDVQDHVYIAGAEKVLRTAVKIAPQLPRCALDGTRDFKLVDLARQYGCTKLQLFRDKRRDYFNQEMIDDANASGIRCNLFWSDDPSEAVRMIERGISTILTNDFLRVATAVHSYREALWAKRNDARDRVFAGQ